MYDLDRMPSGRDDTFICTVWIERDDPQLAVKKSAPGREFKALGAWPTGFIDRELGAEWRVEMTSV